MLRFGTDGIRANAGDKLTTSFVRALGQAAAHVLGDTPQLLIGRDTRASGPRIAADLAIGWTQARPGSADRPSFRILEVLPTPAIALRSEQLNVPAAVISASHNPWFDNGVKFFAAGGVKLNDGQQGEIEALLPEFIERNQLLGSDADRTYPEIDAQSSIDVDAYATHLVASLDGRRLDGLRVVLDTGHGAAFAVAPRVFRELGADVVVLNNVPDGENINNECGSTYPASLQASVVAHGAHLGLAFDGDADRCLAVDERGALIDGDQLMVALALDLAARDALVGNTVVVTVMSNLGLHIALHAAGIETVATAVGDRAVMAAIEAGGFVLGGEQSGHVIVRNRATTGDGTLTGLLFADALLRGGVAPTASALAACMQPLPQVLVNVKMAAMPDLDRADTLWEAVRRETEVLGTTGRVLVRASGTEPLIRVMVEAASVAEAEAIAQRLADVARALRG